MAWDFGFGLDQREDPRLALARMFNPSNFGGGLLAQGAPPAGKGLLTAADVPDDAAYASLPPPAPPRNIRPLDMGANVVRTEQSQTPAPENQSPSAWSMLANGLGNNSDALLAMGAGLMSGRNWGEGLSKGIEGMQTAEKNAAVTGLARQKLGQQQQGQTATLSYLMSKGLSREAAVAATLNPAILSSTLSQMTKEPSVVQVGGYKFSLKPGEKPSQDNMLGPADEQKPTLTTVKNPDGTERQVWLRPGQTPDEGTALGDPYSPDKTKPQLVEVPQADGSTVKQWITPGQVAGTQVGAPVKKDPKDPTEAQSKDALFAARVENAEQTLSKPEVLGALQDRVNRGAAMLPGGNSLVSKEYQAGDQATRSFINAILRRESGAAIAPSEFDNANKQYIPQPGDDPETLELKRREREIALHGLKTGAGRALLTGSFSTQPTQRNAPPDRAALEAEARRRGLLK